MWGGHHHFQHHGHHGSHGGNWGRRGWGGGMFFWPMPMFFGLFLLFGLLKSGLLPLLLMGFVFFWLFKSVGARHGFGGWQGGNRPFGGWQGGNRPFQPGQGGPMDRDKREWHGEWDNDEPEKPKRRPSDEEFV